MNLNKENNSFYYHSEMNFEQKQMFRQKFSKKSIITASFLNLFYLFSIYLILFACFYIIQISTSYLWSFISVFCAVIITTRQMRGLENIVHFGSHNNFSRQRHINDRLTNYFAAWPMLQDVRQYRIFHTMHHGEYASDKDPCRIRLENIGANSQNITNNTQLLLLIAKWMPKYIQEFYREVKSDVKQVLIFGLWHSFSALMITIVHSWQLAVLTVFSWLLIMFFALPFLRSIAELSEHDYELGKGVAETTFNNLGLLDHLLIHPTGDAWHSLHHLHPTVSWWKQRQAHNFLMKHDPAYLNVINRDQPLQDIAHFPIPKKV